MYATIPESINKFSKKLLKNLGKCKRENITGYVASIILNYRRKVTLTGLGKTVLNSKKFKTTVCSFFRGKKFHSRDFFKGAILALIMELNLRKINGTIVLIIDGCCIKRGANTKIENAKQYRIKKTKSKGRSTKSHSFVKGLIILPNGLRIPAPRFTHNTKSFCRKYKKKYKTQHELAREMIKEVRSFFPESDDFVVIADSFFDSKELFLICKKVKATLIVPADSARIYIDKGKRKNLHKRASYKKRESTTYRIIKGDEKHTKEHARYHNPGANKKDVYKAISEKLNISGLGNINVVFSWKMKKRKFGRNSFKALLCNNMLFPTQKILELYALRWQIEIFFRELKSDLGLKDFCGRDFKAFERYIDIILLAYLYLEWRRYTSLKKERSQKEKGKLKKARTRYLINLVREEAEKSTQDLIRSLAA